MTTEYIRYALTRHEPSLLIAAYREAGTHLANSPECLGYDLTQCDEDPNSLIVRIHWVSADAHMQGFRRGPNFPPFLAAIRQFVPEIAEMRHYHSSSVEWHR